MTENNKSRPKAVKKIVIVAAAVILVMAVTLATAATVRVDFGKDVIFGNNTDVFFYPNPETGEEWIKDEYLQEGSRETFTLDIPEIVDREKIPIPEGYELNTEEIVSRADVPEYSPTWESYLYDVWNKETDENGTVMIQGKTIHISIIEKAKGANVVIEHDGEMFRTKVGDVDLYYYREEFIPTDWDFEHDSQSSTYLAVGEQYQLRIYATVYDTNSELYDWDDLPTMEEIIAIVEAVENMFNPD